MSTTQEVNLVTIEEAAAILGLKRSQARAVLGEPYNSWFTAAGRTQYVYLRSLVENIKTRRENIIKKRIEQRGYRSCYHCHEKFTKSQLCDGLCNGCYARKVVKNYACHGDCYRHELDVQRLEMLKQAIKDIETGHAKNRLSHPES